MREQKCRNAALPLLVPIRGSSFRCSTDGKTNATKTRLKAIGIASLGLVESRPYLAKYETRADSGARILFFTILGCSLSVDGRCASYDRDRVDVGLTSDWL